MKRAVTSKLHECGEGAFQSDKPLKELVGREGFEPTTN